jgi:hypothetical protein
MRTARAALRKELTMCNTTSQKTVPVEIVRSTRKAHLVSAQGEQFWIQARCLRVDGTVTQRVFESAMKKKAEWIEDRNAERAAREAYYSVESNRETKMAIGTEVDFLSGDGEQVRSRVLWFPKSMLVDGQAPGWMIQSKIDDALSTFSPNACAFISPASLRESLGGFQL